MGAFDFSKIEQESITNSYVSETKTYTGAVEFDYLTITSLPRELQKFWFLCRKWDDGQQHYEIRAQNSMFIDDKGQFRNLTTEKLQRMNGLTRSLESVELYVRPRTVNQGISGWRIFWDKPKASSSQPGIEDLIIGESDPVRIQAPTGNKLGIFDVTRASGEESWWWWGYVSCASPSDYLVQNQTTPVPIVMNILEVNIEEPPR